MNILKEKELSSLQFNKVSWDLFRLGEHCLLLQASATIQIEKIHESTRLIKTVLGDQLMDIVPSYNSIALFYSSEKGSIIERLASAKTKTSKASTTTKKLEIPICYELGLDLEEVATQSALTREEVINIHLNGVYRAILIGFTPGFIYMDGLDARLACPRKANPRKYIEFGSIGIGGEQTGIYSLASPGGWNIIGRTPLHLFDSGRKPPMSLEVGFEVSYRRITKKEFESWGS